MTYEVMYPLSCPYNIRTDGSRTLSSKSNW